MRDALTERIDRRHPVRRVPPTPGLFAGCDSSDVLGRIGTLEVRLARDDSEVAAAQSVRFRVFHEELGAVADRAAAQDRRDADRFDEVCDHLLVVDTGLDASARGRIVGTYRLLRQESAVAAGGYYSQDEFDLDALTARHPDLRFLELGRSCVLPEYRSKRTIELLWQGIWTYVRRYRIDVMTGCASFHGTEPALHAQALTFLARNCACEDEWQVAAIGARYRSMELLPAGAVDARAALGAMPPLIKGYLRLGARIGDGCVIDHQFGTTDVFIVLPVASIAARYVNYYAAGAQRLAT